MLLSACDILTPVDCTTEVVPGVVVELDYASGTWPADPPTGYIRDRAMSDTLLHHEVDGERGVRSLAGAWERPGRYLVVVVHPAFEPWIQEDVEVDDARCHVKTRRLSAHLVPR